MKETIESRLMDRLLQKTPRANLALLPTPLESASRLSACLPDTRVFLKRDDYTGLAFGGNKLRKLEFVAGDALAQRADVLITIGGLQSNFARQTAATAAKLGFQAVLVLNGLEPTTYQGNLLVDSLLGAEIRFCPYSDEDEQVEEVGNEFPITGPVANEMRLAGRRPYLVPLGASTPLGNLGYIVAIKELMEQSERLGIDVGYVVVAVGSGGTHAGIELGLRIYGSRARVLGISISRHLRPKADEIAELCNRTIECFDLPHSLRFTPAEIDVNYDYVGDGYAVPTEGGLEAIRTVARSEGVLLCPVYTGKAMDGMLDLLRRGELRAVSGDVVFFHTGGQPALFACSDLFGPRQD